MTVAQSDGLPPGVVLGDPTDLGGSTRSTVHRREVRSGPREWGGSVIVKRFVPMPPGSRAAMGYQRELVGLAHLPGTPRLLAHDDASQTLVMEDLGTHPTLADVLLAHDAKGAWRHTVEWAAALGRTVRTDPDTVAAARHRLGDAVSVDRDSRRDFPRRGLLLLRQAGVLRDASVATAQLLDAIDWLEHDTHRQVLGPGDACPDNALLTERGVRLLDLEGAGVRHLAYEAAYVAEPFSTCWCVFTPPKGLTDAATGAFTAAAGEQLPGLQEDPDWPRQVRVAVAAWVFSGTLWLLEGAEADRPMGGGPTAAGLGPPMRALLVSRWSWVARECATDVPDVAAACDEAAVWARRAWREGSPLELPPYPAFGAGPVRPVEPG